MWTVPDPPDGFIWRLLGGQDGQGLADLSLASGGLVVASVVRWGDGWAFLPGPWRSKSAREFRPAPTRGRALFWAGRWAVAHRPVLEFLDYGPGWPSGLDGPFRLAAPLAPPERGRVSPEEAFWRQHYALRR